MKILENRRSFGTALVIAFCLLLLPQVVLAWPGLVIGIRDGDTITVLREGRERVKIRLYGIDCPEKRQAWGNRAKEATAALCHGQTVEVIEIDTDRYGRTVAMIRLPDGSTLQEELMAKGMAWVWPRYCQLPVCLEWAELEEQAKDNKVGLWQDAKPVPPWEWRKNAHAQKVSVDTLSLSEINCSTNVFNFYGSKY